jgi:CRP-like cAMP-binding protein
VIAVLPKGSFFGDYQILFQITSNVSFKVPSGIDVQLMVLKKNTFLSLCSEYPRYASFLRQRALQRRCYFQELIDQAPKKVAPAENNLSLEIFDGHAENVSQLTIIKTDNRLDVIEE